MKKYRAAVLLVASLHGMCTFAFTLICRGAAYSHRKTCDSALFSNSLTDMVEARANLLQVSKELRKEEGAFVISPDGKSKLNDAVAELESASSLPTQKDYEDYFAGNWTLLCTTATTESKLPFQSVSLPNLRFLNSGPFGDIKSSLQERFVVQQRIRSKNRIDHVLQYTPPDTLNDLFPDGVDLPEALLSLNVNPLQVKESKVTLIHKAEVLSVTPVLRTKLGLESIVLNVAGENQILDPAGADVLGLNLPLGEFLNSGTFDTTYMDSEMRISRGKVGVLEQLRIFTKSSPASAFEEDDDAVEPKIESLDSVDVDIAKEIAEEITEEIIEEMETSAHEKDDESEDEVSDTAASSDRPDDEHDEKKGGDSEPAKKESAKDEAAVNTESEEDETASE